MMMVEHDDGCEARSVRSIERRHLARRARARAAAAAVFLAVPIRHPARAQKPRISSASPAQVAPSRNANRPSSRGVGAEARTKSRNWRRMVCLNPV